LKDNVNYFGHSNTLPGVGGGGGEIREANEMIKFIYKTQTSRASFIFKSNVSLFSLLRTRNISFMGSHLKRFERTAA
jgi:hypothetical protein